MPVESNDSNPNLNLDPFQVEPADPRAAAEILPAGPPTDFSGAQGSRAGRSPVRSGPSSLLEKHWPAGARTGREIRSGWCIRTLIPVWVSEPEATQN